MSVTTILENLGRRGVRIWSYGEELRYRGPKKVLTPEVLAELKARKKESMFILRGSASTGDGVRKTLSS